MLFDDFDRSYTGYRDPTEGSFDFLNRSARPDWQEVRVVLEKWFAGYPSVGAADLRSRFRSRMDRSHWGAWWELYSFTLLSSLGFAVSVHPQLSTGSRRPDFHAVGHDERLFVEATSTTSGIVDDDRDPEREAWIEEAINATDNPDFFVHLDFDETGTERPSRVEVTREVDAWLATLDPDQVLRAYELTGELPIFAFAVRDWKLKLRAIPKSRNAAGKHREEGTSRLVGMGPITGGMVDDVERIRDAIDEKRKAYGRLADPLVVAHLSLSSTADDETITEVLFGNLAVEFHPDRPESARTIHQANGIWTRPRTAENDEVAAVLVGIDQLLPWTIAQRAPTLWVSPTAGSDFGSWYPFRLMRVSDGGRLAPEAARAAPWEILGLWKNWPKL